MFFEKKIIIGSITSFLATAIGIIAIFFPDLFNLQKEKIYKIQLDILTQDDIKQLQTFLDTRVKDDGIFELDICIPLDTNYKNFAFNTSKDRNTKRDGGDDIRFIFADNNYKFPTDYVWSEDEMICEDIGIKCYDIKSSSYGMDEYGMNIKMLKQNKECLITTKGNFYFNPRQSNPEFHLSAFTPISDEQLRLKNY